MKLEKIIRIEKASFKLDAKSWQTYEGYMIVTDKQTIKIGIGDEQSCCEVWGYLTSEDDTSKFEGASLLDIKIVDTALNKETAPVLYEGGAMFIDLETDIGVLQFVVYNDHNGYYGHSAVLVSTQVTAEKCL